MILGSDYPLTQYHVPEQQNPHAWPYPVLPVLALCHVYVSCVSARTVAVYLGFTILQTIEHSTYSCNLFRPCHSSGSWTLMNVLSLSSSCNLFRLYHSSAIWTLSSYCEASGSRLGSVFEVGGGQSKFLSKFLRCSLPNCSSFIAPYLHTYASWTVPWPQPGGTLLQPWAWEALSLTQHVAGHQSREVYCYIIQSFVFVSRACELFCYVLHCLDLL